MFSRLDCKKRLMDAWHKMWDEALDSAQKNKLKMMLDGGTLILFFRYEEDVFGAPESSRVTFAKMKDENDEDHTPGWIKEANFMATNLTKLGQGSQQQMIFYNKDLPKIDVLSKEEAYESLEEFFEKEKDEKDNDREPIKNG
jgi:hypothetical protein